MKTLNLNVKYHHDSKYQNENSEHEEYVLDDVDTILDCCHQLKMDSAIIILTKQVVDNKEVYTLGAIDKSNLEQGDRLILSDNLSFIVDNSASNEVETIQPDVIFKMPEQTGE